MATSIIKPVHAGIKQSFSLPTTSASYTAVTDGYKYTWLSDLVTEGCRVEVEFSSSNTNTTTPYIEYDKKSGGGGIDFTVKAVPTTAIPVVATIICAQTGNTLNITDSMVHTTVIAGTENLNEALTTIDTNMGTVPSGKNLQGEIDTLNSNIDNIQYKLCRCKVVKSFTSGSISITHDSDLTYMDTPPTGYTRIGYIPYTESNGALWYQFEFTSWASGFIILPHYSWSNTTVRVYAIYVKNLNTSFT